MSHPIAASATVEHLDPELAHQHGQNASMAAAPTTPPATASDSRIRRIASGIAADIPGSQVRLYS